MPIRCLGLGVSPSAVLGAAICLGLLSFPGSASAAGLLLPTRSGVAPLAIRYHRVNVTIRERVAETRVEQAFRNHTAQTLEATYIFPVPEGASVSGFAMWVNGRRQRGELLDAAQARRIYEQIVARVQDPGLVEMMGGNLFRARVFPVLPNAEQRIEIRFSQTLSYDAGIIHYKYPLRTEGPAARTLEDMTLSASIVSRTPIRAVYSPTHAVQVVRPDEHHATVGFEHSQAALRDDFDLYYAVQDRDVGLSLLTHRPQGEDGYFLAMIAPRSNVADREIAAKDVIFVFDTSGSMAGDKIERARSALRYMLQRLRPADRFQVVRFSTDVETLFDGGSVHATRANVQRASQFVRRFVPAGGTAIHGALTTAVRTRRSGHPMPRMVVFLTDGMPTIGETDPARIVSAVSRASGDARLFVFGVGDDVNTTFLDQLARRNRGVGDYFRDGQEMERRLSSFYDRIAYPLFTDLRLEFPGLRVFDVYPQDLGHLYRGEQLLVVGRYRGEGQSQLRLRGRASNQRQPRTFDYGVRFPRQAADNDWLPRLWATRKVGFLLDQIRLGGERPELRAEVIRLARAFGIVTPYTSYLVVEDEAVPPGLMPVAQRTRPSVQFDALAVRSREEAVADGDFEGFAQATSGGGAPSPASTAAPGPPVPGRSVAAGAPPPGGAGARGRRLARRLRSMREAERSHLVERASVRLSGGRPFQLVRGMWVDSRYRRSMRTIRVRYGSPAFFELLRALPTLRGPLSLGERVTVALPGRRAIIVEPDAPNTVNAEAVRRFVAPVRR